MGSTVGGAARKKVAEQREKELRDAKEAAEKAVEEALAAAAPPAEVAAQEPESPAPAEEAAAEGAPEAEVRALIPRHAGVTSAEGAGHGGNGLRPYPLLVSACSTCQLLVPCSAYYTIQCLGAAGFI